MMKTPQNRDSARRCAADRSRLPPADLVQPPPPGHPTAPRASLLIKYVSKEGRLHCLDDFEQSNNTAMFYFLTLINLNLQSPQITPDTPVLKTACSLGACIRRSFRLAPLSLT
jgi:hypothetical protein